MGANGGSTERGKRRHAVLQGVLPLDRARVPTDMLAGVTLAALAIPEVMGYAKIAGMPVVTGLYTILIPIAVFAVLGSSRHLVVGADSATAAIMAAGLTPLAVQGSPEYVALAGTLALMTAVILVAARSIRLGFLADFLSRTVLVGFLTGVGIQVALGQLPAMLGITVPGGRTLEVAWNSLKDIGNAQGATLVVSISVIVVIVGLKRFTKKVPGALVAVIGAITAGYFLDLASKGVALLGTVPSGLPSFGVSHTGLRQVHELLPTAASIFLVILAQSAATSRAYAVRHDEAFDENVDLVGLGLANAAAGLSGAFVVNGSPTKTEIVDEAGGGSQVSQLTTAVIVLLVLLFLTGPLAYLPEAALASVVFLIGMQLIDVKGLATIHHMRFDEFVVAALTAVVVVAVGVEQGIILAIVLSLLAHVRYSYHPYDTLLVRHGLRLHWVPVAAHPGTENGLAVYRFASSLFYANTHLFASEVMSIVREADPPVRWLCVESAAMADVDWSGGLALRQLQGALSGLGVRLVFSGAAQNVRAELERYGIVALVGEDAFFDSVLEVVEAFQAGNPPGAPP